MLIDFKWSERIPEFSTNSCRELSKLEEAASLEHYYDLILDLV